MLTWLADYADTVWGPLRLFRYLTFRCFGGAATALVLGFAISPWVFARLRTLKLNQAVRDASEVGEELARLHAGKNVVPTMGGVQIVAAVLASTVLWARPNTYVGVCVLVFAGLALIGFMDDYLKVTKRNSKGLPSRWKLAGQAVLTAAAIGLLYFNPETHGAMSALWAPFFKGPVLAAMPLWFAAPFFFLVMAGSSNAINVTDGLDGLAIGCTISVALVYAIFAYCAGNRVIADYLFIAYVPGAGELAVMCTALVGGGLAFLWYNAPPATVFMGDTGALALGGLIGTVAFIVQQPLTLIIVGGMFVIETGSVLAQMASYRFRGGRRVLRMAPIHHHFELSGWAETKVVVRFWILSVLCALAGLSTLKLR